MTTQIWGLFDGKSSSLKGKQLVMSAPNDRIWQIVDITTGETHPDYAFGKLIAIVQEDTPAFGEFTPNARLIAAAPALYDAAQAALYVIGFYLDSYEFDTELRADLDEVMKKLEEAMSQAQRKNGSTQAGEQ